MLSALRRLGIRDSAHALRQVWNGGGPGRVRLSRICPPRGWVFPTTEVVLEVVAKDGRKATLSPALPVPFPYAWAYRVARALGVPLA